MIPFTETLISPSENLYLRKFSGNLDPKELKWHWDEEDRLIKSIQKTNWKFQFDDCLPQEISISEEIFIPKGIYHRLIKGDGDLVLEIKKSKC